MVYYFNEITKKLNGKFSESCGTIDIVPLDGRFSINNLIDKVIEIGEKRKQKNKNYEYGLFKFIDSLSSPNICLYSSCCNKNLVK